MRRPELDRSRQQILQQTRTPRRSGTESMSREPAISATAEFVVPLVLYVLFAAVVYFLQGPEPALSIDHISYFKLADEIRVQFPKGDYWRSFSSVRAYGVILAYLFPFTGSHIESLKALLAGMTVAYLAAFQVFMGLATRSRAEAVGFSLLSALFVSFGASIWGMTDFAASLNRTIVLPFVVLIIWHFLHKFDSPWRYAVFPLLILVSMLHLSALHVFLVFCVFEALDFLIRRRCRIDRNLAYLAAAIVASVALQGVFDSVGAGTSSFVKWTVAEAVQSMSRSQPPPAVPEATAPKPVPAAVASGPSRLSPQEAWTIELMAFPWRNLPPSIATLAVMALSFGVIFLLSAWGALVVFRSAVATRLDKLMLMLAGAVVLTAFGPQTVLWVLRHVTSIYPVNFEEIRVINVLMIPSMYFVFRLYECVPAIWGIPRNGVRIAIIAAFIFQPILLIRTLPSQWREEIIEQAMIHGLLARSDAPRVIYARQFLGLAQDGARFYYSAQPVIAWLERNADRDDRVLTNLNEFHDTRTKSIGPFLKVLGFDVWDADRAKWAASLQEVDRVLATGDIDQVTALASRYGATYVVVTWPVKDAVYRDKFYSVVRVK